MSIKHQLKLASQHFRIEKPEDWTLIGSQDVLAVPGCGRETLDHLRVTLAGIGLTLKNDATPDFWNRNVAASKLGVAGETSNDALTLPFTILIDSAEGYPFTFQGHRGEGGRPLIVPFERQSLGPTRGDYAIKGMEGEAHIERKSMEDAQGTFLSHGERRDRWMATLEFLASIKTSAVVIECSRGAMLDGLIARGSKDISTMKRELHGQVLAWEQDYRVPFVFYDTRFLAEKAVITILHRHYRHKTKAAKRALVAAKSTENY